MQPEPKCLVVKQQQMGLDGARSVWKAEWIVGEQRETTIHTVYHI